ncbi:hypothetical protein EV401DRAFT_1885755 [Pisolithus croceorrhizus]|nr:hypothetical protein EV401DRAFT_1885755 [Pisolithus croceorrhizus]
MWSIKCENSVQPKKHLMREGRRQNNIAVRQGMRGIGYKSRGGSEIHSREALAAAAITLLVLYWMHQQILHHGVIEYEHMENTLRQSSRIAIDGHEKPKTATYEKGLVSLNGWLHSASNDLEVVLRYRERGMSRKEMGRKRSEVVARVTVTMTVTMTVTPLVGTGLSRYERIFALHNLVAGYSTKRCDVDDAIALQFPIGDVNA